MREWPLQDAKNRLQRCRQCCAGRRPSASNLALGQPAVDVIAGRSSTSGIRQVDEPAGAPDLVVAPRPSNPKPPLVLDQRA